MLMVAVSVTDWPVVAGLRFDEIVMDGVALAELIVCELDPVPLSNESSPS